MPNSQLLATAKERGKIMKRKSRPRARPGLSYDTMEFQEALDAFIKAAEKYRRAFEENLDIGRKILDECIERDTRQVYFSLN